MKYRIDLEVRQKFYGDLTADATDCELQLWRERELMISALAAAKERMLYRGWAVSVDPACRAAYDRVASVLTSSDNPSPTK